MHNEPEAVENDVMHHREITLPDGRYMIFYTFGSEDAESGSGTEQRPPQEDAGGASTHVDATPS